jgi:hypothetical protein
VGRNHVRRIFTKGEVYKKDSRQDVDYVIRRRGVEG